MVPGLEDIGIEMLLNENHAIERDNQRIYLAGIDDAHYYRVDNIEKAATGIPFGTFSILLSHAPEVYQQAVLCRLQLASLRAHPWRANLSSGADSNHFGFGPATSYGCGTMEVP